MRCFHGNFSRFSQKKHETNIRHFPHCAEIEYSVQWKLISREKRKEFRQIEILYLLLNIITNFQGCHSLLETGGAQSILGVHRSPESVVSWVLLQIYVTILLKLGVYDTPPNLD